VTAHLDDPIQVGRRLRQARLAARLTLRELAFPGCSAAYISQLERGRRTPSLQVLVELGRRLGLSSDRLAWGTERDGPATDPAPELRIYWRALAAADTPEEKVWALAGLGQAAAISGEGALARLALRRALGVLGDAA
jgi:transcriptional regulator with XRE-family HTH domain